MSTSQTLERIAMEADKEARSLRRLSSQLRRLGSQVSDAIADTATGDDRTLLGHLRSVERDVDRAADDLFTGAREARAAAAEERRREVAARSERTR